MFWREKMSNDENGNDFIRGLETKACVNGISPETIPEIEEEIEEVREVIDNLDETYLTKPTATQIGGDTVPIYYNNGFRVCKKFVYTNNGILYADTVNNAALYISHGFVSFRGNEYRLSTSTTVPNEWLEIEVRHINSSFLSQSDTIYVKFNLVIVTGTENGTDVTDCEIVAIPYSQASDNRFFRVNYTLNTGNMRIITNTRHDKIYVLAPLDAGSRIEWMIPVFGNNRTGALDFGQKYIIDSNKGSIYRDSRKASNEETGLPDISGQTFYDENDNVITTLNE